MPDIFLSYAHQDRERIEPLVKRLQQEGWSVWWDRDIVPGKRYEQLIDETIREARCVVVAWSEASLASSWVHNEALEGLERDILVPLMLEEVRVPVAFRQTQAAMFEQWPEEYDPKELDYLLRGIREVLGEPTPEVTEVKKEQSAPVATPPPVPEPKATTQRVKASKTRRWPMTAIASTIVLASIGWMGWIVYLDRESDAARNQALQELVTLREITADGRYAEALVLAENITAVLGEDAIDPELWDAFSTSQKLLSEPPGASVSVQPYNDPDAAWQALGTTPIEGVRLANHAYRVRFDLPGYTSVTRVELPSTMPVAIAEVWERLMGRSLPLPVTLQLEGTIPEDMVFVPGGPFPVTMTGYRPGMVIDMADFFISRHEVTNTAYQQFVTDGGYAHREYWQGFEFKDDGGVLSLDDALARFKDASGRSGPAGWQYGQHLEGSGNHPVTGISWYEAMAYARYAEVELPTAYHWNRAAIGYAFGVHLPMIARSNFSGTLASVGKFKGHSQFGLLDAAGNAAEWVQNETMDMHAVLGGSAAEPKYMLVHTGERPPMTRDPMVGFRTIIRLDPTTEEAHLKGPVLTNRQIAGDFAPVSDDTYAVLKTQFEYRPMVADTTITDIAPTHPRRTYELVDLKFADGTHIPVFIIRPKGQVQPLQPVIVFPGQTEFQFAKDSLESVLGMRFLYPQIVDSGRAVIWPIYHGSNERYQGVWEMNNNEQSVYYRDAVVTWRSELGRVIDYLEEREDIDTDKLAYLGTSYGSSTPAIAMTQEPRFKVAMFTLGGYLELGRPPVAQPWNFLSRLRIPTLMINGRYDTIFPHEESQTPMYATLGAPADQKQHFIYDGGHGPDKEQEAQVLLWITDWLDQYLGRPDA